MMMGEVNDILITELRNKILAKLDDINSDHYHENDIQRVQNDNSWLRRFILHHEYDMEAAFAMAMDCLKWRKEFGIHDIEENKLPQHFFESQILYPYGRDKEENKIVMFHIRLYHKDHEATPDMKRFLVYWMEKIELDEKGHPITVIFDMRDTGFSNMDMDFVKFFISLFKFYYPSFLGYLIVYEMPWILNTAWKLIKTWLSARAVEKIKFVNKNTILDYVTADQLPPQMGGTVHFAETESDSSIEKEVQLQSDVEIPGSPATMRYNTTVGSQRDDPLNYSGSPAEELNFAIDGSREPNATITLTNNSNQSVAFKVKTTSPEKYRVRPSSGIIRPHCQCEVIVQLQSTYQTSSLTRDKFLVMAIPLEHVDICSQELCEIWRLTPKDKIMDYK
uniref:Motile sperm domain-containing protein 2 n=1 Tax=Strigamia maritima TaxID=126957 RepID=T1IXB2_STRMM